MNESYIIFECLSDLKHNILATAVVSSIKKAYPERKIIVVTTTPEVWLHNPNVFRFYTIGKLSYFYDDFILNKDTIIMRQDPANTEDFIYGRKHLIEIWCDLCGVPYDGSLPSLHFTWREKEAVEKLTPTNKPLFLIQTNSPSITPDINYFWPTDVPTNIAQDVVNKMNNNGYQSVHIRTENQIKLDNTLSFTFDPRLLLYAISRSEKRLFIDSYAHQASAAFGLPSTVIWVGHTPKVYGYDINKNITATINAQLQKYIDSYSESYLIGYRFLICPYDLRNIFDADKLVDEILK